MRISDKVAPLAAVAGVFTSIACCLPFGIAAAAGAAGVGMVLEPLRPWLIGLSVALLGFGLWQLYRTKGTCQRRSRTSLAIFWTSMAIVLAFMLFPQAMASFLADRLPAFGSSHAPPITDLASIDLLRNEFNQASSKSRVIILLSPT